MFENVIVKKPWGHEYLLHQNENVGIWYLCINHAAKTSLHSHPNKRTGLIVLSGVAKTSFMNGFHELTPCDKIMIRNGVFHSTEAISENGVQLLEIETPNNKEDIIRLEDNYGRAGEPYEGSQHYIEGDKIILSDVTKIGDCILSKHYLTEREQLIGRSDSKIMILEGMIFFKTF